MKVIIIDDHLIFRESLGMLLEKHNFEILACVGSIADLQRALEVNRPDVVLLDFNIPGFQCEDFIQVIKKSAHGCRILMLTGESSVGSFKIMQKLKVDGIALKDANTEELLHAIHQVLEHKPFYDKRVSRRLDEQKIYPTPSEAKILGLLVKGLSTSDIAEQLLLKHKTVENHRYNLMQKFEAKSSAQLVYLAGRQGFVDND